MLLNRICRSKYMSFKNKYMSDKPLTTYVNQLSFYKKHMSYKDIYDIIFCVKRHLYTRKIFRWFRSDARGNTHAERDFKERAIKKCTCPTLRRYLLVKALCVDVAAPVRCPCRHGATLKKEREENAIGRKSLSTSA